MNKPIEAPHVPCTEEGIQRLARADAALAAAMTELQSRVAELEEREAARG